MSDDPLIPSAQPLTRTESAELETELARDLHVLPPGEIIVLPPGAVRFDKIGRPLDANSRVMKGAKGTNLKGRPRSGLAFAEAVREKCDPHALIDIVLRIARGEPAVKDLTYLREMTKARRAGRPDPVVEGVEVAWPSISDRLSAITFLRDAGYSKPAQQVEIAPAPAPPMIDYSKLTDDELDQLEALHAKAAAKQLTPGPGDD